MHAFVSRCLLNNVELCDKCMRASAEITFSASAPVPLYHFLQVYRPAMHVEVINIREYILKKFCIGHNIANYDRMITTI